MTEPSAPEMTAPAGARPRPTRIELCQLGRSGLYVSRFALGTMTFGMKDWGCDEETSIALVHRYLDAGGNFLDTADVYGSSEDIVGRALKGRRHRVVVATKAGLPVGRGPHDKGTGRLHLRRACENSLRRLQTDYLDLYQVHFDDPTTPIAETLDTLDDLVREGKVRYIGASNFQAYRLMKALATSDARGKERFVSLQGQYNLIVRTLEREHLPLLEEEGLGFIAWSPLAAGMLTGKISAGAEPEGTRLGQREVELDALVRNDRGFAIAAAVVKAATELGCTPAQLSLAWQSTRPVTATIIGARTMAQLEDNLAALTIAIPEEILAELDRLTGLPDEYPGAFLRTMHSWLRR
ncbi:aldo/keto reductase [Frankia sp. Cpl3]|uniref:aldo/keto reductase n=1 Tax=Parafrankia colletiae TaxID=573497 RepID=UPI000A028257|nr:aldo/keto reductase [Parafrankia colletiae]MCK9900100.1 aldo/keto reductase [Frankia sp. Cpl3]